MGGGITLYAYDKVYHKPAPTPGTDYEIVYTTLDNMKSFNAAGWAVDGSGGAGWSASNREVNDYVDPATDAATGNKHKPSGVQFKQGQTKAIYMYVKGCKKIKAYMAGQSSGDANKQPKITAKPSDGGDAIVVQAPNAISLSEFCGLEVELDQSKEYEINFYDIKGSDCLLYALRLYGDYVSSEVTTYKITPKLSVEGAGVVSMNPTSGEVIEGNSITLTANANVGYRFENWTDA